MKKYVIIFTFALICLFSLSTTALAHELFIQIDEDQNSQELRVDIIWGHIRDVIDPANHENYTLFVRYPSGETTQLELQKAGVFARSYVPLDGAGEYIFWAMRNPSIYSPSEGVNLLSIQMAKTVYQVGDGATSNNPQVNLDLEIIPQIDLSDYSSGTFQGLVYREGSPVPAGTVVNAYGPNKEILEGVTDDQGSFSFELDSQGIWLIKANLRLDESGSLGDADYSGISMTTTLAIDTTTDKAPNGPGILMVIILLLTGVLLGASGTFLILGSRKS